jgi:hypothetical protein
MIERGMSADEICRVIRARSGSEFCRDPKSDD